MSFLARMFTPSKVDPAKEAAADYAKAHPPAAAPVVDPATNDPSVLNSQANRLGRAALIATSPQGVLGTNPTGRYKLLGNDGGLGN